MWKNFLQQWRHRIQTVFELFLPVITMCLVLILRFGMIDINNLTQTRLSVAYSPTSPELDDVVRSAMANLIVRNMKEINLLPIINETLPIPGLEIPPDFDINDLNINSTRIYEIIKRVLIVHPYNSSDELRGLYAQEETIREVNWFSNDEGFSDYAVFTNTPWTVLLFYIDLYLSSAVVMAHHGQKRSVRLNAVFADALYSCATQ
ncbi:ATP-binding cassette sub-family A member 7, partial [Operophtera brumata]